MADNMKTLPGTQIKLCLLSHDFKETSYRRDFLLPAKQQA